jgi:hypothetical protein
MPSPSSTAGGCAAGVSPLPRPARRPLRATAGEASLARLAVSAPHRAACEIVAQGLWLYCGLMVTGAEATGRRRRLRALVCGRGRQTKASSAPAAVTPLSGAPGEGKGGGAGAAGAEDTAGSSGLVDEAEAAAVPRESSSTATGGTGRGRVVWGPRPLQGPRAWSAAPRHWRWGRAARWAVRGRSRRGPLGWRDAWTAGPSSALGATRSPSGAVRRAGRCLRRNCL